MNRYKFSTLYKKARINPIKRILTNIRHVSEYGRLLESGYTDMETWGALRKCWRGYNISRSRIDLEKQVMYAERIQKLQKELGLEITNFANIGVYVADVYDEDDEDEDKNKDKENQDVLQNQDVLRYDDPLAVENQDVLRDDGLF